MKNKLIKRRLFQEIISLLKRKEIFAIVGPRQAGKTTLLKIIADYLKTKYSISPGNIFYFNFEDPLLINEFEENPAEFVKSRLKNGKVYFFFDEFHYTKEGGKKLKLLYDLFPQAKIFISGSSSLELTFATAKYLVGRIFYFRLFPLDFAEFLEYKAPDLISSFEKQRIWLENYLMAGKELSFPKQSIFERRFANFWEEFITFGGYPEVVKTREKEVKIKVLENVVSTYLQREIRTLLLVEDVGGYQSLLRILASQSGDLLNLNQVSNDSGLNFLLLKKHLEILKETFVIQKISPFHHNITSELRKTPKVYFLDNGLRNLLLNNFSSLVKRPDKGKIGEMFVFQQFFKRLKAQEKINFWRTRGGAEVDFVFTSGEEEIALEVKIGSLKKPQIGRSLYSFLNHYPDKRVIIFNKNLWRLLKKKKNSFLFAPIYYA